ncbi:MAG: Holliday junction branch migration protein RuvA [Candidatus Cloacimonetes bacterium]|nr:Holliday junction branch migration protein RuvA [Candidatus Cloacimonadota bacterium]
MISHLRGKIIKHLPDSLIVSTDSFGFRVRVPTALLAKANEGAEIELFTHLQVRGDELLLYGFSDFEELTMFEMLIAVSGVGPKMALGVLSGATVSEIKDAVSRGDSDVFTSVSGIGRKNAGRIILELRPKLGSVSELDLTEFGKPKEVNEVIAALKNLGYSTNEARQALKMVDKNLSVEEKIKEALKVMGK